MIPIFEVNIFIDCSDDFDDFKVFVVIEAENCSKEDLSSPEPVCGLLPNCKVDSCT